MTEAAKRFSLRDLPIPAKLVVTCFLFAVGGGYSAAMVQLHMQDSKSGEPMPTVQDVILKYTGKKWFENEKDTPKPVSKLEKLIMGSTDPQALFGGGGSMGPAFFSKDASQGPKNYRALIRATPHRKAQIDAAREGERQVLREWINAPDEVRREAYAADRFVPPPDRVPKAIDPDWKNGDGFNVKSLLDTRCVACHGKGGPQENFSLETYEQIEKYMAVAARPVGSGRGWVKVEEPISLDKLTQSTHAHLLSFAVLFSLTGLVFAFTSYPTVLRCLIGPWVLIAVVADVSLWWLARLCEQWGPYFAMGIIGTGGEAGVGLMLQVALSLLNMYGVKGKFVVLLLFAAAGVGAWQLYINKVKPGLEEKQRTIAAATKPDDGQAGKNGVIQPKSFAFLRVLQFPVNGPDGKEFPVLEIPFPKDKEGGMVRAFFDKDSAEFAASVKEKDPVEQMKLTPARHGEREALLAWAKLADPERRKAFESDAFQLPTDIAKRPITADYLKDGKVKVQSLVTDRCIRCHADEEKVPFKDYDSLLKHLK